MRSGERAPLFELKTSRPSRFDSRRIVTDLLASGGIAIDGGEPWDIRVHDERFFDRLLREESLGLGESYMDGWWDCPSIDQMICRSFDAELHTRLKLDWATVLSELRVRLLNLQSIRRAPRVARTHYDLGNAFFERMLGPTMTYSCGYWRKARTLEESQDDKHELVCEKLDLDSGDRLLDIGCGWGRLLRHATEGRGCRAIGITLSQNQIDWAKPRSGALSIDYWLADYRDPRLVQSAPFDKIVSVGMFEHVGRRNYRRYMECVHRLLADDGLFLLHTIGNHPHAGVDVWTERYIFPNSVTPSQRDLVSAIGELFIIEDWHNFGADYDRTLMAWHENFERHAAEPDFPYDERFKRMWRLYLLMFAGTFRSRMRMQLWQLVLAKKGRRGGYRSVR